MVLTIFSAIQSLALFGATEATCSMRGIISRGSRRASQSMFSALSIQSSAPTAARISMGCIRSGRSREYHRRPDRHFVFRGGVVGAAIATVLGQLVTAGMSVWYLCHTKILKLKRRISGFPAASSVLCCSACSFLAQISLVIAMAQPPDVGEIWGAVGIRRDIPGLTVLGIEGLLRSSSPSRSACPPGAS